MNKKTDWEEFIEDPENSIIIEVPQKSPQQHEEGVDNFITSLQKAA